MATTAERVIGLRLAHPDWTLKRIGDEVGVTMERSRQILAAVMMPTRAVVAPPVPRPLLVCLDCGRRVSRHAKRCRGCAGQRRYGGEGGLPVLVTFACEGCGELTTKRRSSIESARRNRGGHPGRFCSRRCGSIWAGRNNAGRTRIIRR